MADLGYIALLVALFVSLYSVFAFVVGARRANERLLESARNGFLATLALVTVAVGALLYSLLTRDFSIAYVADYASRDMSALYVISSVWAGNSGSLLTWSWLVALFGGVFLVVRWNRGTGRWCRTLLRSSCSPRRSSCFSFSGRRIHSLS